MKKRKLKRKKIKHSDYPHNWVILELPMGHYKVFGTWSGGYLGDDKWRVNSGISKIGYENNFYYFYGHSGSIYKCHKECYGNLNSFGAGVLKKILEDSDGRITLLEDRKDWKTLKIN